MAIVFHGGNLAMTDGRKGGFRVAGAVGTGSSFAISVTTSPVEGW